MEASFKFSTNDVPMQERAEWWREMICRQYANVEIISPMTDQFTSETIIYPLENLQLSKIRSSAIAIKKLPREPHLNSQDAYFAFISLSGGYFLEQDGRKTFMHSGDITLYDATRLHETGCLDDANTMLCFSVPRAIMRSRIAAVESCTAIRISGAEGVGAIASNFLRTAASQVEQLQTDQVAVVSECALDMLTLAITSVRPVNFNLSRSRSALICHVKAFIDQHLANPVLDTQMVATGVGLSPRYINKLFQDENTSLMRYILQRRLDKCRENLLGASVADRITDIAFRWGFNDLSHFSRAFRQRFDISPKDLRRNSRDAM